AALSLFVVLASAAASPTGAWALNANEPPSPAATSGLAASVFPVFGEHGYGAGFLCDSTGLVLTGLRVSEGSAGPRVWISPGRSVAARVLARSPERGIAVLCVNPARLAGRPPLPLAKPRPEESLVAEVD